MNRIAPLLPVFLLLGCAAQPAPQGKAVKSVAGVTVSGAGRIATVDRTDVQAAHADGDVVVLMDVYTLTLPMGGVSANAEFWKRIDEDHLDISNHDLLLRNGLRYGIGAIDDWESFFKPTFDQAGAKSQKGSLEPNRAGAVELPAIRSGIEFQDILYLDAAGAVKGRTYQHCDDLFTLAYESVPNHPSDTRVRLCAMVRDQRFGFVVTEANRAVEVERKRPEYLYDLKVEARIPIDHFLVISPSDQGRMASSLGGAFLTRPGEGGQAETVLVLVPKPMRLRAPVEAPAAPVVRKTR